jgi:hypothetical protein
MRRTRKRETHLDGPHWSRCATSVAPEPITPDPRLRTTVDQSVVNGGVSRAHPAHLAGAPFRLGTFRWHPPAAARDSDRKQAKDANRAGRRSIRERRGSGDGDRRVCSSRADGTNPVKGIHPQRPPAHDRCSATRQILRLGRRCSPKRVARWRTPNPRRADDRTQRRWGSRPGSIGVTVKSGGFHQRVPLPACGRRGDREGVQSGLRTP